MALWTDIRDFRPPPAGTVLTVGAFDGVHRGHAAVLAEVRRRAAVFGAASAAITFEPHPLAILAPERNPPRLTTSAERAVLLGRLVEHVIAIPTTRELLALSAEEFIAQYLLPCQPRGVVEGPDFQFGQGRSGSLETLRAAGLRHRFEVHAQVEQVTGEGGVSIRSSAIRDCLRGGEVSQANELLGRVYRLVGRVGSGQGRGATIGFPTANLDDIPHQLPDFGVYAALAQTERGALHRAAVNIGPQPTFAQMTARVEAFLLDFDSPLRGQKLGLHLLSHLRMQKRFENVAALVQQLQKDSQVVRELILPELPVERLPL